MKIGMLSSAMVCLITLICNRLSEYIGMKVSIIILTVLLLSGCATDNSLRSEEERAAYKKALEHQENRMMDSLIFGGLPVYSSGAME